MCDTITKIKGVLLKIFFTENRQVCDTEITSSLQNLCVLVEMLKCKETVMIPSNLKPILKDKLETLLKMVNEGSEFLVEVN